MNIALGSDGVKVYGSPGEFLGKDAFALFREIGRRFGFRWSPKASKAWGTWDQLEEYASALEQCDFLPFIDPTLYPGLHEIRTTLIGGLDIAGSVVMENLEDLRSRGLDLWEFQIHDCQRMHAWTSGINGNPMGLGKGVKLNEELNTPTGWRLAGDLRVGDMVTGRTGPTRLTGIFPQGTLDFFRVTFSDGAHLDVDADHLWTVQHAQNDTKAHYPGAFTCGLPGKWRVLSTRELLSKPLKDRYGNKRWRIPLVSPVVYEPQTFYIDPYVLGVILGDGSIGPDGRVSLSSDMELIQNCLSNYKIRKARGCFTAYTSEFSDRLQELQLQGTRSHTKFVPSSYMLGDCAQRLSLLQGLMDTDGYPMPDGGAEFCSTSMALMDAVMELVQSLGGICRGLREAQATYVYKGERRRGKRAERLNLKLPAPLNPFRLGRKADLYKIPKKYQPTRLIESIEYVGRDQCICFKVEAEDELFVASRDFVVTHNTLQTLMLLRSTDKLLVVCPKTAKKTWPDEAEKWFPGRFTVTVATKKVEVRWPAAGEILVAHYDILPDLMPGGATPKGVMLALDEIQLCRGKTKRADKVGYLARGVMGKEGRAVGLTGTPLEKNPLDLWNLLKLLKLEKRLFGSKDRFRQLYGGVTVPIEAAPLVRGERPTVIEWDPARVSPEAKYILSPVFIRHEREDVRPDMPGAIWLKDTITMQDLLEEAEPEHIRHIWHSLDRLESMAAHIPTDKFMGWVTTNFSDIHTLRASLALLKTASVVRRVESYLEQDEPVVVMTPYVDAAHAIADALGAVCVTGESSELQRNNAITAFQKGEVDVIVMTIKTGGLSINLNRSCVTVFADREWNHSLNEQAEARTLRGDQDRTCIYHDIEIDHPVERRVKAILKPKKEFTDKLIRAVVSMPIDHHATQLDALITTLGKYKGAVYQKIEESAVIRRLKEAARKWLNR